MFSELNPPLQPLSCFFVKKRLSDSLDHYLPEWIEVRIQDHLKSCNHCQKQFNELKLIQSTLKIYKFDNLPDPTVDALIQRLKRSNPAKNLLFSFNISKPFRLSVEIGVIAVTLFILVTMVPKVQPHFVSWWNTLSFPWKKDLKPSTPTVLASHTPVMDDFLVHDLFHVDWSALQRRQNWDPGTRATEPQPVATVVSPVLVSQNVATTQTITPNQAVPTAPTVSATQLIQPPPDPAKLVETKSMTESTQAQKTSTKLDSSATTTGPKITETTSSRAEKKNLAQNFEFYTITMNVAKTQDEIHPRIIEILQEVNASRAGKSEFGETLNGGLYYHLLVEDAQFDRLKELVKTVGSFKEKMKVSTTGVPGGFRRVALWIGYTQ